MLKSLSSRNAAAAPVLRHGVHLHVGAAHPLPSILRPPKQAPHKPEKRQQAGPSPQKILQSFNTWAFKREHPSDTPMMLEAIARATGQNAPLPFVFYWGKGPRLHLAQPDTECLDYLASFAKRIRDAYQPGASLRLIFTDTHARLNGHTPEAASAYFSDVEQAAWQRGFETCWLGPLVEFSGIDINSITEVMPEESVAYLSSCAAKWYQGGKSHEEGALEYFRMNMVEKRAVEGAFPHAIFATFNGSKLRVLFPDHMPIFYMYSLRRGFSVKPWFLGENGESVVAEPSHA